MVELRLLGPVELWSSGTRLELGPPKQRCVLGALGIAAGTAVTADALLDRVWGDAPPPKARAALHTYVARLRKVLDATLPPGSTTLLRREFAGYALRIDPEDVDAQRFRRLIEQARRTPDAGERGALLREALAQWRGDPLSGIAGDWAESVRVSLRELRLNALVERVDVDLTNPVVSLELVDELTDLAAQHPLSEPLASRLMSALSRAGRPGDALLAYERIRKRLADELGNDPGSELRLLHQQLLRHGGATGAGGSPDPGVPRQLPIAPAVFVGRTREFAVVTDALRADEGGLAPQIAVLHGSGGVGKSALALRVAHAVAGCFPGGQLYLNLQGWSPGLKPLSVSEALSRLLQSLGVPAPAVPAETEAAAARLRSLLADRRVLMVLDNAADAAQVRPLLPAGARCAVLVTSRRGLFELGDAHHVALKVLPAVESVDLLSQLDPTGRCAADPQRAAALAQLCGHLPLAIRITAARVLTRPDWPLAEFEQRLSDRQSLLDQLGHQDLSVRACFETSYLALHQGSPLDQAAAAAFRLLGLPDGPDISLPIAARLFDIGEPEAERSLDRLVEAQLLESAVPGRYRMHDLIRLYARELAERDIPEPDRYAALARTWRCYVATTVLAGRLLRPGFRTDVIDLDRGSELPLDDRERAMAWLAGETANLLASAHQASSAPADLSVTTTRLAHALFGFMHGGVRWAELWKLNQLALKVARGNHDRPAEAQILSDLGVLTWRTGDGDEAIRLFSQATEIFRELEDALGEGRSLGNLGNAYNERRDLSRAIRCLQRALDIYRKRGFRSGEALVLNSISQANWHGGNHELAIRQTREALAIYQQQGDTPGEAYALRHLGSYLMTRDGSEAIECLEAAVEISRRYGDDVGVVWGLTHLGRAYRLIGDPTRAREISEEALVLGRQTGSPQEQGIALLRLGAALVDLGDAGRARAHLAEAVTVLDQLGAPESAEAKELLRQAESDAAGQLDAGAE